MTLKSALQDLRETTLVAVSGLLAKLQYLGSLRRGENGYQHWGMSLVHGEESSGSALKAAHGEVLSRVLRTSLSDLEHDLKESSDAAHHPPAQYIEGLQENLDSLLPAPKKQSGGPAS